MWGQVSTSWQNMFARGKNMYALTTKCVWAGGSGGGGANVPLLHF